MARKFLAYFTIYFGLIAVTGSTLPESPEQQVYSAFEALVTDFSKRNCSLNSKIFMTLEDYYRLELNCSVPQLCHQCKPCQPLVIFEPNLKIFHSTLLSKYSMENEFKIMTP